MMNASSLAATVFVSFSLLLGAPKGTAIPAEYAPVKKEAERLYREKSFQKSLELYEKADAMALPAAEARWVDFRVADTTWRAQAGAPAADSTRFEKAETALTLLVRDIKRVEDRDLVWVEVMESLGDFHWARVDRKDWSGGWQYYQQALEWWAGAREIETARERYIAIVKRIAEPPWHEPYYYFGYYGNQLPLDVVESYVSIVKTDADRAHAQYLLAMTIKSTGGDYEQLARIPDAFEAALKIGKTGNEWYDEALWQYAEQMNSAHVRMAADGTWYGTPDYPAALDLYRRLMREFKKGESRYWEQADQRIKSITTPVLSIDVSNAFLPGSEIQFSLAWRNLKKIDFTIHAVDLAADVSFGKKQEDGEEWLQAINLAGRRKVKAWSKETGDKGAFLPGNEEIRVEGALPLGAYVIEASSVGRKERVRELILVTDAAVVIKTAGRKVLTWFADANDGKPIAKANVSVWAQRYRGDRWVWMEKNGTTDASGLSIITLDPSESGNSIFVAASAGARQAFSNGYTSDPDRADGDWKIYAFTDRPAYRPGDEIQWKLIARKHDKSVYSTPAGRTLEWEVFDPLGAKAFEGKSALNAFGSAWGSFAVTDKMPLGEYRVNYYTEKRVEQIGSATLFRLEEYKLPEFAVKVATAKDAAGKPRTYRVGDKVEVEVQVDYYFGGAVANAAVEVLVHQNGYSPYWSPHRNYAWFYEDVYPDPRRNYGGYYGSVIKREQLKTDATGKAKLVFDTPRGAGSDYEYRIEARVTDSSRREVVGSDTVRVTRQKFFVHAEPAHYLHRPQDKVTVDFKALDANDQPVSAEGTVKVTRDRWYEVWLDPTGKEVAGERLRKLQEKPFPPAGENWRLKFQGYEHEDVLTRTAKTNDQGETEFTFTAAAEGYYRIVWTTPEKGRNPVTGETTVWVATNATTELGYRHGGLEIIVDKDTFKAGQKAPVMIASSTADRWVLFTVEGSDLYSHQVVHLTGTVKLVEVAIEEKHVPNIWLGAEMVADRQLFSDSKQVIVPPVEHFLEVEVKPDRTSYLPREEATWIVSTKDHLGKPVAAEVALSVVDESIFYIQQDLSGDPREFFFGTKRQQIVQTQSTFSWRSYQKLVVGIGGELIDESQALLEENDGEGRGYDQRGAVGYGGLSAAPASIVAATGESSGKEELSKKVGGKRDDANFKSVAAEKPAPDNKPADAAQPTGTPSPEGEGNGDGAVQVRSDFRATALFEPGVITDADGFAKVKAPFPDSLTGWKAVARAVTKGNQFGIADATVRTRQPLIVRLQAPRFFVVGDTTVISAVINNNTDAVLSVATDLSVEGLTVEGVLAGGKVSAGKPPAVDVPAGGEARVDWRVRAERAGTAKLKAVARSGKLADAMEKSYPVHEHGIEKTIAHAGKLKGDEARIAITLPKRREGSTVMRVQVSPSQAVTMLDALPYLVDYPYGCTEQTMSRFLPAVITAKTLEGFGLDPEVAMSKVFGGIERAHLDQTHKGGKKNLDDLDKVTKSGLKRLYDFQHADGGWGWWKDGDSDRHMTAYVLWGMVLAKDAGVSVKQDVVDRAADWLDTQLVNEELDFERQAWMLHALSAHHASGGKTRAVRGYQAKAFENLWKNRAKLNAYGRALLTIAAVNYRYGEQAKILADNLENGAIRDKAPDKSILLKGGSGGDNVMETAHWGEAGTWWRWSDGAVETTAFVLKALIAVDPKHRLVEPSMNWLVKNRRGAQWSNTRDTAIVVLALSDYLKASGELGGGIEYELLVNGKSIATRTVGKADVLQAPSMFEIDSTLLRDGENEIRLVKKSGKAPLYFFASATFFSLEEPIAAAGHEMFVRRQYFKSVGRPTLLKGFVYDKQPLNDGDSIKSGERVEVVVTIETKNDYEYLLFEDLKPAGLEAVEVRSGEPLQSRELKSSAKAGGNAAAATEEEDYTGRSRWVHQELRDRNVALFVDKLGQGVWEIRYELRAEVPGTFHALPLMGHAMYVPEIRANGDETRIEVLDR